MDAIVSKDDSPGKRITVDKARLPYSEQQKAKKKKAIRCRKRNMEQAQRKKKNQEECG